MPDVRECSIDYFISLTHCQRKDAIELLEKTNWKLDESLNLFFEQDRSDIRSKSIDAPYQQSSSKTIIMPALIEFNRFMESFHLNSTSLLENSSKMVNLAIKYAKHKSENIPRNRFEDWKMHLNTDHGRLQTLLDNGMCAPLVWIEHFDHLLNGNVDQLFDCDYMFNIIDYKTKINRFD